MTLRLHILEPDFEQHVKFLLGLKREAAAEVEEQVAGIIRDVRERGDEALKEYSLRFDNLNLETCPMRVSGPEREQAVRSCSQETLKALDLAAERIRAYHLRQMPQNVEWTDETGTQLGWRFTPVDSVGLYVPGGTAAYPSSVLMNAVPAKVAGVARLVMVVPAPEGQINPAVLAAADRAGVDEIYRIGGAQAIAALAWGTASIAPVVKIVGPGNAYVASAKKQVFGQVGIDMIAGPSEVLIIADETANPHWIAADLLAQAEHDTRAQSILITTSTALADQVEQSVMQQCAQLIRRDIAEKSWKDFGAILIVQTRDQAAELANRFAAEHVEIMTRDPEALAKAIPHAGAIFLGGHTPEAIGDYVAGSNHVLPTSRAAAYASGLGVQDFLKRTSILKCSPQSLQQLGPAAISLAITEGLQGHARSVALRLAPEGGSGG